MSENLTYKSSCGWKRCNRPIRKCGDWLEFPRDHSSGTTRGTARKLRDCHHFSSPNLRSSPPSNKGLHQRDRIQLDYRYAHNTASRPVRHLLLVGIACVCATRFVGSARKTWLTA